MISPQKRILVVDDDEMLREMHSTVFEEENYLVDSASNGSDAWALLTNRQYDLLATDMFMPEPNGFELILMCQKQLPELKTILLSGGGEDIEATHGQTRVKFQDQEIDIDAFLQKPFDLDEMLSIVARILQG